MRRDAKSSRLRERVQILDGTKGSRDERQAEIMRQKNLARQKESSHKKQELLSAHPQAKSEVVAYKPVSRVQQILVFPYPPFHFWLIRSRSVPFTFYVSLEFLFSSTSEYPKDMPLHEIYVDIQGQSVFVPVNGSAVPLHISMIKNVVQPEPDLTSA